MFYNFRWLLAILHNSSSSMHTLAVMSFFWSDFILFAPRHLLGSNLLCIDALANNRSLWEGLRTDWCSQYISLACSAGSHDGLWTVSRFYLSLKIAKFYILEFVLYFVFAEQCAKVGQPGIQTTRSRVACSTCRRFRNDIEQSGHIYIISNSELVEICFHTGVCRAL